MAIKVNNDVVIDNDRRAELGIVNFGAYTIEQLRNKDVVGTEVGDFVYNIGTKGLSYWTGSEWTDIEGKVIGGAQWRVGDYNYHMFTSPGVIRTNIDLEVEALIIGGGGGGGSGRFHGAGGAGGFRITTLRLDNGNNGVAVGEGGKGGERWFGMSMGAAPTAARGKVGGDSSIAGFVANGGGREAGDGGSGGGDFVGSGQRAGGSAILTPDGVVQGNQGGGIPDSQNWDRAMGLVSSGGGGAKSAGIDRPVYDTRQVFQCAGAGYLVSEFAGLSSKYPGITWSIPSSLGEGFEKGVCGGGAGYYTRSNPYSGSSLNPAHPIGGGGVSRHAQSVEYLSATGYGGGGGVGGFNSSTNYQAGNGKGGVVIVRYNVNSLT